MHRTELAVASEGIAFSKPEDIGKALRDCGKVVGDGGEGSTGVGKLILVQ